MQKGMAAGIFSVLRERQRDLSRMLREDAESVMKKIIREGR
jgi:hypothetical protein